MFSFIDLRVKTLDSEECKQLISIDLRVKKLILQIV